MQTSGGETPTEEQKEGDDSSKRRGSFEKDKFSRKDVIKTA